MYSKLDLTYFGQFMFFVWIGGLKKAFYNKTKVITSAFLYLYYRLINSGLIYHNHKLSPLSVYHMCPLAEIDVEVSDALCSCKCFIEDWMEKKHFILLITEKMLTKRKNNLCFKISMHSGKHGGTVWCMAGDLQCMYRYVKQPGKTLLCAK